MADLNIKQESTGKKVRTRKSAPKVDLTAMVDLAFLLITFFMLTTSLNKPQSLDVALPDKGDNTTLDMDENRLISLIIEAGQLTWYHGDLNNPLHKPTTINLEDNSLRKLLFEMGSKITQTTGGKDMIVLIKPSKEARTIDIIQTLDEMKISNIKRYVLSKTNTQEEKFIL